MDDLSFTHNARISHSSCPLRAYPYNRIKGPVMETQGPVISSLIRFALINLCLGAWEVVEKCHWLQFERWGRVKACGCGYSVSHVRFICLTCWAWIHIVLWLGVSRGVISYYLWRVLHPWFIRCRSRDCAGALCHHYSFKRDPNFLCPSRFALLSSFLCPHPPSVVPSESRWGADCDCSLLWAALWDQTRWREGKTEQERSNWEKSKWICTAPNLRTCMSPILFTAVNVRNKQNFNKSHWNSLADT